MPPDLFGFCAALLRWSGVYSYYNPGAEPLDGSPYIFSLASDELKSARSVGIEWAECGDWGDDGANTRGLALAGEPPKIILEWWKELLSYSSHRIIFKVTKDDEVPRWCQLLILMTVAADEASFGIGRFAPETAKVEGKFVSWADLILEINQIEEAEEPIKDTNQSPTIDSGHLHKLVPREQTIATSLNKEVACVQPKSRTSPVGCTLRALSQNLALLPHRGELRVHCLKPASDRLSDPNQASLNLVLIPYPFNISTDDFEVTEDPVGEGTDNRWGWFHINQRWLPHTKSVLSKFIEFVDAILAKAAAEHDIIHGLVFPEYSLDWSTYQSLTDHIAKNHHSIELFVAGASNNCEGDEGNFVLNATFMDNADRSSEKPRDVIITSRAKHHRWCLEKHQIASYGWEEAFDPIDMVRWEKISLPPRQIHTHLFREGSTYSTLICEDLARSEPCHEALRAVGPNLLFVLLMDGPQITSRWSCRYATGMAEDPGSSVLTFTSRALVEAANSTRDTSTHNWAIGLWKDPLNPSPVPIECAPGSQAAFLKLTGGRVSEASLDNRIQPGCWIWAIKEKSVAQIDISGTHSELVNEFVDN